MSIAPNGVGCADRLIQLLTSSSVVLLQRSDLCEYWQHDLKPYRNYLPLESDFANLEAQIAWAEAHPKQMKAILERNKVYAARYLSSHAHKCYLAMLLAGHTELFRAGSTLYPGSEKYLEMRKRWITKEQPTGSKKRRRWCPG